MLYANEISLGGGEKKGKMPVGIHTNCTVTSIEVGDNFIDFHYENQEGKIANKRVWTPTIDKVYPRDGETNAEAFSRQLRESLAHLVKHMHIFMTKEQINAFGAPDFLSFAEKCKAELTPLLPTKRVNLSLIYDSNGEYSTFGRYPNYIEEYVEGQEPKIAPSKWEQENRMTPKQDDSVTASNNSIVY